MGKRPELTSLLTAALSLLVPVTANAQVKLGNSSKQTNVRRGRDGSSRLPSASMWDQYRTLNLLGTSSEPLISLRVQINSGGNCICK